MEMAKQLAMEFLSLLLLYLEHHHRHWPARKHVADYEFCDDTKQSQKDTSPTSAIRLTLILPGD